MITTDYKEFVVIGRGVPAAVSYVVAELSWLPGSPGWLAGQPASLAGWLASSSSLASQLVLKPASLQLALGSSVTFALAVESVTDDPQNVEQPTLRDSRASQPAKFK